MSVINKMLRDLDQRQSPEAAAPATADTLRQQGIASVPLSTPHARRAVRWGWWLLLLLVVGMVGAGWWQWQQMEGGAFAPPPVSPVVAAATPVVTPVPMAAVSAPLTPAEVVVEASTPPVATLPPTGLRMDDTLSNPPLAQEPASVAPAKAAVVAPPAKVVAAAPTVAVVDASKKAPAVAASPSVSPVPPATPALPAADAASLAQRQQQAARETLAQAQALWNSGARDNAITLLHDAVAAAERAVQTTPGAANTQTLVSMLRELGRMELAEGRASAVWDLLTRLEPLMANQPELWALRANAAQRLGRHQDSVQAYTTALQSRPAEQRWLLGAAVSLAALGQTTAAAEMAEKARAVGPVSKEVQTYLRQQGVPLAER